jgi:hypothetical protein
VTDGVHDRRHVIGKLPGQPQQPRLLHEHGWKELHDSGLHGASPQCLLERHPLIVQRDPFDGGRSERQPPLRVA